jgi:hypothetical protein
MKKTITSLLAILLLCFWEFQAEAQKIVLSENGKTNAQLLYSEKGAIDIEFKVNGYTLTEVKTKKGKAFSVSLDDGSPILEKGAPDLSKLTRSVIIPDHESYVAQVISSEFVDVPNIDVVPSKGNLYRNQDPDKVELTYGRAYQTDAFYPGQLTQMREPYILRDLRGQTVIVFPVQYNPVQKTLRIYTRMIVRLTPSGEEGKNPLVLKPQSAIPNEFEEIYQRQFINYTRSKYTPVAENGRMLIVCPAEYMDVMAPLVTWKKQRGQEVEIVEFAAGTTGTTAAALKTYITNYYNTYANSFLLLVGDGDDIPSLSQSGDSDVAYSYISGNDSYPEFFVGRFSAESSADVTTQVNRTIYYEKSIGTSATWLNKGVGIASAEGTGGQGDDGESDKQHMNNIKTDLIGYNYSEVTEVYDPGASANQVANAVNDGRGIIDYVGHGADTYWVTSGFSVSDCNALTNENKCPLIFDVACVNGNFHNQTCFAEGWLRASKNGNPTGAVAIIASTINQSWAPPMDGQDEMIDILTESYTNNIKRTFGGVAYNGCLHMNDQYGSQGDEMTNTWTTFGDPSLLLRTSAPTEMTISHESEIFIGTGSFPITCNAEGAIACLSLNGEILGKATVSGGTATIGFTPLTDLATVDLVITGYNKVTYITTISVLPAEGPYISVQGFTVGDVTGNNNGIADFNESILLNFTIKNVGVESTGNVQAVLTSSDSHITISNNTYNYGSISAGQSLSGSAFQATLAYNIADQYQIPLKLSITDNQGNLWEKNVNLTVNAPNISLSQINVIEDGTFGDGNGRIDPNESGYITVSVTNNGHSAADLIALNLSASSPYVILNENATQINNLAIGSSVTKQFKVTANAATPQGTSVNVSFTSTSTSVNNLDGNIIIGQLPELQIGNGTTAKNEYPFYNYYENNKSQMVYFASEFPSGSQVITDLAFNLASATQDVNKRDLANFTITIGTTSQSQMPASYITLTSPIQVFSASPYLLPSTTGWCNFDIQDYTYDPSQGNLVIEISWGDNGEYCGSNDQTGVYCSTTTVNTVSYGFIDTQTPPAFSGNSTSRPNVLFKFQSQGSTVEDVTLKVIASGSGLPIANAELIIGSVVTNTDATGTFNLQLAHGTYPVSVTKNTYFDYTGTITVDATHTFFNLAMATLGPTHNIQVTVNENDLPLAGVSVNFAGSTLTTQVSGTVTFHYIPEGTWDYSAEKDGYYPVAGQKTVDGDETMTLDITKIPTFDIAFTVMEGNVPIENALVSLNNQYLQTNANGEALFTNVPEATNLAYHVSKSGYISTEGTIDALADTVLSISLVQIPDVSVIVEDQYGLLVGATVVFQSATLNTDSQGKVQFTDVNPGTQQVIKVSKTNYYTAYDTIDVTSLDIEREIYLRKKTDLTVVVTDNNTPIKGAEVYLGITKRITNVNGMVTYKALSSTGNVIIKIITNGYYNFYDTIDITYDDDTLKAALQQIPDVTFVVKSDGQVVEGATVSLNNTLLKTNTDGNVTFANISAGEWVYSIEKTGLEPLTDTLLVGANDTLIEVSMLAIPDLELIVTDGTLPLTNAKVAINGINKLVDENGKARFTDIGMGSHIVTITCTNYITLTDTIEISSHSDVSVAEVLSLQEFDVVFTVTDGVNVLEGVSAKVADETKTTDNLGKVTFTLAVGADYAYSFSKDGYNEVKDTIDVVDQALSINVELILKTYSVKFVVSGNNGFLAGALVAFNNQQITTDENGEANFNNVAPGTNLTYSVSKTDYLTFESTVSLADAGVTVPVTLAYDSMIGNTGKLFNVYPNPSNGLFNADLVDGNSRVRILNVNGQVVYELKTETKAILIDLQHLAKGVYFMQVTSDQVTEQQKIIIE